MWLTIRIMVLGLLVCALPMPSMAAAKSGQSIDLGSLGAPSFTTFSSRDGVPDSVIVSIQVDQHGFVWLGSQHGLARYDSRRWVPVDNPALAGYVDDLFVDHDGTLWAASRTFGLARHDGRHWHLQGPETGMASQHVRRVGEIDTDTAQPKLWASSWDKGLFFLRNGRWHADRGNSQLPHAPFMALAQTRTLGGKTRLWLGTGNRGLWYREGNSPWQAFQAPGFADSQIEHLYVTRHNGHEALWISMFGGGVWRLDKNGLRSWTRESGDLPTNEVYNITSTTKPDGEQTIWVASRAGLIRIDHDKASAFDRRSGLPSDAIRNISQWRSPNGTEMLWLATESGVARLQTGRVQWTTASMMGARQTGVFGVLVDHDPDGNERLWVASAGDGLGVYSKGRWRHYSKRSGDLPDSELRMIKPAEDLDGKPGLWLGVRFGSLIRIRPGPRFEPVPTPWARDAGEVAMDMLSRRIDGHMEQWFATRTQGIYRRTREGWKAYRPEGVQGQWAVVKLQEQITADGHRWLWASSNQGLARYDGRQWTLLGEAAGLPGANLIGMTLLPDRQGKPILWLGSSHHGIIRVDVSDPMHPVVLPDTLPAPPDLTAYDALRDSKGRIYICTNAGVQQLTPRTGGYDSRVFTRRDGLLHDECNTNAQLIDAKDRFWTGTLGGLSVYDPRSDKPDHVAKPLRLTDITVDDKAVASRNIQVPPGHHEIRIEYALLAWQHEGMSRFRSQLLDYEASPTPWSKRNYRSFSALPAGDYVLQVQGRDYAGNISGPLRLPIHVAPWWWERTWAQLLFALTMALGIYGLLRWRTRALEKRQSVLEQKIAMRTTELHDANQRLRALSYQDALTGLANRRHLLEELESGSLRGAGKVTSLILIDVDLFKEYNDRFGHPAGDEALRCVARDITSAAPDKALVARYGGEEFACLLPDCSLPQARTIGERMRARVASGQVSVPGSDETQGVTISAGVAGRELKTEADAHQLLRDADIALYQAKGAGRNCLRG